MGKQGEKVKYLMLSAVVLRNKNFFHKGVADCVALGAHIPTSYLLCVQNLLSKWCLRKGLLVEQIVIHYKGLLFKLV